MKRIGKVFVKILERSNFRLAFYKAAKGKRHRNEVRRFAIDLEKNLSRLMVDVRNFDFPFGQAKRFTIYDPKKRNITAPSFPERVIHHAIVNIVEPVFEKHLIYDSYACRVGKGRISALQRAQKFTKKNRYVMAVDIKSYFASISHEILIRKLNRKFKDEELLELFGRILNPYQLQEGTGLPIGSLTSQHFANFYLGEFDRFARENLGCMYLRYMDDSLLFGDSLSRLHQKAADCQLFLESKLDLRMKPPKMSKTSNGYSFLGCRVYADHLKLNGRSRRRFQKRMFEISKLLKSGQISENEFVQQIDSMISFAKAGGTKSWKFRKYVLEKLGVNGQGLEPSEPGW